MDSSLSDVLLFDAREVIKKGSRKKHWTCVGFVPQVGEKKLKRRFGLSLPMRFIARV